MTKLINAHNRERWSRARLYGLWRGVVEYNIDPLKHGRCKVRIPHLHSTEEEILTTDLPWASPQFHFGGFHDGGAAYSPPVGSTVWVQFEQGDPTKPVYFGAWFKTPNETREMFTKTDPNTEVTYPEGIPVSKGTWAQPPGPEVPQEILAAPYEPTVTVIHKSPAGHTILFEDRDGYEVLRVIDRAGQEIRLSSPVDDFDNQNNAEQRGMRSAIDGDYFDYDALAGGAAEIEFVGVSGSGIKIHSREDSEYIEFKSTSPDNLNQIKLSLRSGEGSIELVGINGGERKFKLNVDLGTGAVEVESEELRIKSPTIEVESDELTVKGDISVDGNLTVRGDATISGKITGAL